MKSATGLRFSAFARVIARVAGWAAVTMTLALILAILAGRPLVASTPAKPASPEKHHNNLTGPWIYQPVSFRA
jgi:hypothetical protein